MRSSVSSVPPEQLGTSGFWLAPPPVPVPKGPKNPVWAFLAGVAAMAVIGGAFYAGTHMPRAVETHASGHRPAVVRRSGVNALRASAMPEQSRIAVAPAPHAPSGGTEPVSACVEKETSAPRRLEAISTDDVHSQRSRRHRSRELTAPAAAASSSEPTTESVAATAPSTASEPAATEGELTAEAAAVEGLAAAEPSVETPVTQRSLDELMGSTISERAAATEAVPAPAPATPRPMRPSRAAIRSALSAITSGLRACTAHRGVAMMSITMSGAGAILAAQPIGSWAGEANAGCLRSAVDQARIPPFEQPRLTVRFPFVL
jgi:hypothetical protein